MVLFNEKHLKLTLDLKAEILIADWIGSTDAEEFKQTNRITLLVLKTFGIKKFLMDARQSVTPSHLAMDWGSELFSVHFKDTTLHKIARIESPNLQKEANLKSLTQQFENRDGLGLELRYFYSYEEGYQWLLLP
ncbi:hypothetical protein [Adhaeribacter rhizoryzae]|uniref:Uncharacterized protein n=1 Tax=Adhaeribacter rhizoryzae TaxID=2607907 RepID=A0A5M6DSH6_9BACT|nr:hypothetical protein [Adhaeribacter rhizoryzae]KAA5548365.1 hypothetical protein F0145_06465 [Adhaeribacter rhizoryzae]